MFYGVVPIYEFGQEARNVISEDKVEAAEYDQLGIGIQSPPVVSPRHVLRRLSEELGFQPAQVHSRFDVVCNVERSSNHYDSHSGHRCVTCARLCPPQASGTHTEPSELTTT